MRIEQRTAEYRISNRRISKDGIASLSLFKIGRIQYFDIRHFLFDIRYSRFQMKPLPIAPPTDLAKAIMGLNIFF
jgi:hypothetical protein